jgi:transposase
VGRLRAAYRRSRVEVWGHDQARRGLKPIVRKVWARRGQRPLAVSTHRYEWTYAYGFVHPKSGKTHWLLMPEVSTEAMGLALAAFARAERVGKRKQVVVVVDRAAWHTTPQFPVPRGIHLLPLPAATPELQPAERLWPLLNEGIANRSFPTLGILERALARRCRQLIEQRALIRNLTCYHWWPDC